MRPIVMEQRLRSEMNVLVPSGLYPAGVVPVPDVRIRGWLSFRADRGFTWKAATRRHRGRRLFQLAV